MSAPPLIPAWRKQIVMGKNSKIEWTNHTANLWWGCTNVHRGCDNCYAETWAKRWDNKLWGNEAPRKAIKSVWGNLAKWQAEAESVGEIHRVFVGSMMDIFEKPMPVVDSKGEPVYSEVSATGIYLDRKVSKEGVLGKWGVGGKGSRLAIPFEGSIGQALEKVSALNESLTENTGQSVQKTTSDLRNKFFNEVVPACPNLMFLLLTKRPSNINKYIPDSWLDNPPANVMYGASVVDQKSAEDVARHFDKVNGPKFLSVEPLLEEISMEPFETFYDCPLATIEWVIVGGESGPNRRPFSPDWARKILNWVRYVNSFATLEGDSEGWPTAFFMKQWDKVKEVPEDLMVRQFPMCHELQEIKQ